MVITSDRHDLPLHAPIKALADLAHLHPALVHHATNHTTHNLTPIQQYAVPIGLAKRDLIAIVEPDSGHVAALILPLLASLLDDAAAQPTPAAAAHRRPAALLLAPSRASLATAAHVASKFSSNTPLQHVVVSGQVPIETTLEQLKGPVDLVLATPGRLLELIERGALSLANVRALAILDADALVDVGFELHLRRLLDKGLPPPSKRLTMLTAGAVPAALTAVLPELLRSDAVHLTSDAAWRSPLRAAGVAHTVRFADERSLQCELVGAVRSTKSTGLALVVSSTRRGAELAVYTLQEAAITLVDASAEKPRPREREAALEKFASGDAAVLVTTDAALRSLELPNVAHVIGIDLPSSMQEYAGRLRFTGRHGHSGLCTTLVGDDSPAAVLAELVSTLRVCGHPVPRWLDAMVSTRR